MIVYKHTCLTNGKSYIGLTVKSIEARWQEHCSDANRNKKRKFFAALNKYGTENWSHEILFESDDEQEILDKEVEFIELFDSVKNGYNTSKDRFRTGIRHTPESIEKMRIAQKEKHARKKAEGTDGGWTRKDGGAMLGKEHPNKGGTCANKGKKAGKIWEEIFGVEGAAQRREAHKLRRLQK
jgi:group I intron endonuclease